VVDDGVWPKGFWGIVHFMGTFNPGLFFGIMEFLLILSEHRRIFFNDRDSW
jgi:hypothetical protein